MPEEKTWWRAIRAMNIDLTEETKRFIWDISKMLGAGISSFSDEHVSWKITGMKIEYWFIGKNTLSVAVDDPVTGGDLDLIIKLMRATVSNRGIFKVGRGEK